MFRHYEIQQGVQKMSKSDKFITFITPMFNMEKYIRDLLASFKGFPKNKYELIIVDNCSTDSSVEICESFSKVLNLKVIKLDKNIGPGFARNIGMKHMFKKTTHFMFIDSDDALVDGISLDKIFSFCDDKIKINSGYFA